VYDAITTGLLFGLTAGLAPGPLLAVVVTETLRHGTAGGIKVALAPLLTDLPIVVLSCWVVANVTEMDSALGIVGLFGCAFVLYLGVDCLRSKGLSIDDAPVASRSLLRGVITNALSPHPYLFWFAIGAPKFHAARDESGLAAAAFIVCFYLCLVGSKLVFAIVAGRSRAVLTGRAYKYTLHALGLCLIVFALLLFRDAGRLLGWL